MQAVLEASICDFLMVESLLALPKGMQQIQKALSKIL